ncbi:MAG TPA: aspartate aminotransferase family protein [Thiolapillus brandeum]|uniref:Acetylornithine aminotransferase n=2 Tax=Thiolapillus TaxID=1608298 RepID=A0A831WB57_9GAMM|nr:aspartate aminotransferase family protein [Thiolapillus brandeum]
MKNVLMNTYNRLPVTFVRGEGVYLHDDQGKTYLDAISGIAVCGLGHAHPEVSRAICEQAGALVHTSNLYGIAHQQELGEKLVELSGMEKVFFANSGAEANEAAIKLARLHGHKQGRIDNPVILVMEESFHGRTLATLTATGNRKVQAGFEPLVQGFARVPYGDLDALKTAADNLKGIVAVLVEPVQGEGGINIPPDGYLPGIRELCDRHDWLMMLDEIQTGMGRTGKPFAFQHHELTPDVMTLAKALGNGVPIGACLANGKAADLFAPGNHGSTFGGNPLACAAGLAVVEQLTTNRLWEQAASKGAALASGLAQKLDGVEGFVEIRSLGLMLGIQLDRPCAELVGLALEKGLLINVTADSVVRLLPPLIISDEQIGQLTDELSGLITGFLESAS